MGSSKPIVWAAALAGLAVVLLVPGEATGQTVGQTLGQTLGQAAGFAAGGAEAARGAASGAASGADGPGGVASASGSASLWTVHVMAGLAIVVGLLLWAKGAKLLKPIAATVGLAAGALAGLLLVPLLGIGDLGPVPLPVAGVVAGGLLGLIIALAITRLAVSVAAAGIGASVGLVGALATIGPPPPAPEVETPAATVPGELAPGFLPESIGGVKLPSAEELPTLKQVLAALAEVLDPLRERLREVMDASRDGSPGEGQSPSDGDAGDDTGTDAGGEGGTRTPTDAERAFKSFADEAAAKSRAFFDAVGKLARARWDQLTEGDRRLVLGASAIGALAGLAMGMLLPRKAMIAVTAPAGAAIWLGSAVLLLQAFGVTELPVLMQPAGWLVTWGVISAVGVIAQSRKRKRRSTDDGDD